MNTDTIEYEEIVYPNAEPDEPVEIPDDGSPEVYHFINYDVDGSEGDGWHGRLFSDRICRVPLKLFSYKNYSEVRGCQAKVEYLAAMCWYNLSKGFQDVTKCPHGLSELSRNDMIGLNLSYEWLNIKEKILEAKPVFSDIVILSRREKAGFDSKTFVPDIFYDYTVMQFIEDDRISLSIIRKE